MALASSIIYNELPRSPAKLFICKRILFWGCHNRGLLMNLKQVLSKRLQHQWCWGGGGHGIKLGKTSLQVPSLAIFNPHPPAPFGGFAV